MQTHEDYRADHDDIDEVYGIDEAIVKLIVVGVSDDPAEDIWQDVGSEGLHSDIYGEKEEGRSEIGQCIHECEIKHLEVQHDFIATFLLMLAQLLFNLFKGEETTVDPSLSLPQKSMHCLDGVDFGVSIRKVSHIKAFRVDTHA